MDIGEDIKRYQDTLSYASSKVDYSMGQNIYILPSDMNLKIKTGTVRYNNKILVSDETFSLGKNENVDLTTPAIKNHKTNSLETPTMKSTQTVVNSERTADLEQKTIISHEDEKVAFNWNIYDMVHFSIKVSHQLNKKGLPKETFFVWATC